MSKTSRLFGILFLMALACLVVGCGGGSGNTDGGGSGRSPLPPGATSETVDSSKGDVAGGSGTAGKESPANEKIRREIQKIVDAKLPSFGLSSDEIACVDHNIATMTSQDMTAEATEPSGGETAELEEETVENFLGPLAQGCL